MGMSGLERERSHDCVSEGGMDFAGKDGKKRYKRKRIQ
jgi:hypothetical protein